MFTKLSPERMQDEVLRTQQALIAIGLRPPTFFRPPYEDRNDIVRQTIRMPFALWDVDTQDWKIKNPAQVIAAVDAGVHPGSIIIMHDIHPSTAAAAETIVNHLEKTYQLVTASDLLKLPPETTGEFTKRP
jgi:peptidoglycan/xylan/chitin deacetylase (PgdA/CDA1 family)